MALGTTRTLNWGKEDQQSALNMAMRRNRIAFQIRKGFLFLAASNGKITLPFNTSCAQLIHVQRRRWESLSPWNGQLIASGISERDVVRATIEKVCK